MISQKIFQNISYEFDPVGNIKKTVNDLGDKEITQTYKYDNLDQLIQADGIYADKTIPSLTTTNKYIQKFNYDNIGNITYKKSTNIITPGNVAPFKLNYEYNYDYTYAAPHQVSVINNFQYKYQCFWMPDFIVWS